MSRGRHTEHIMAQILRRYWQGKTEVSVSYLISYILQESAPGWGIARVVNVVVEVQSSSGGLLLMKEGYC